MIYDNIKSLAHGFASEYLKKNKKTSLDKLINETTLALIDSDIEEYNSKKVTAEKEIASLYKDIDTINTNFKADLQQIQSIYIGDAKEQIEFVRKEKTNYQTIVSSSSSVFENMEHFQDMMKDYLKKIQDFSSNLNQLSSQINTEISDTVKNFKKSIKDVVGQEKSRLTAELRDYYDVKKNDIFNKLTSQQQNNNHYDIHDTKLHNEMEEKWLYTKFHILVFLFLIIAFIDYWIIFIDIREFNDIGILSNQIDLIMSNFVYPFLFSFWVILVEFLNIKVIKKHSRLMSYVLHTLTFILIIAIVIVPTIGVSLLEKWESVKFSARLLIFFMLIPLLVFLMNQYITWDYLKMYVYYISSLVNKLFKKIISPIIWIVDIIKSIFAPIEKRLTINLSQIAIQYQWHAAHELEDKLHIAKTLYKNIDSISNKVHEIKNYSQSIIRQFDGWNKVFDKRIWLLQESISVISQQLNEEIKQLDLQARNQKEAIENSINIIWAELGKDEERLKKARMDLKEWVMEAFNQQD